MRVRQGRSAAIAAGVLGVTVVVAAAVTCRNSLAELYYIQRLHSSDEAVRLQAAEVLADAQSLRAVPHLIRLLNEQNRERIVHTVVSEPGGRTCTHSTEMTPLAYALYRIGKVALPTLLEEEGLEDQVMRMEDGALRRSRFQGLFIWQIRSAIESPDKIVRKGSYEPGRR